MANANKLYPLADALQMKLIMTSECTFGGFLDVTVGDRWFEGLMRGHRIEVGISHMDYQSGNAWCVVPVMGRVGLVLLADNGKHTMFCYVVDLDMLDNALLKSMVKKNLWSRRDLLSAVGNALKAVYTAKSTSIAGNGKWRKVERGVEEVMAYNHGRLNGLSSSDAGFIARDVANGVLALPDVLSMKEAQLKVTLKGPTKKADPRGLSDLKQHFDTEH